MISFTVLTPESSLYTGMIQKATFPGDEGDFQILKNHGPLIAMLREGNITLTDEFSKEVLLPISKSMIMVKDNSVIVLIIQQ